MGDQHSSAEPTVPSSRLPSRIRRWGRRRLLLLLPLVLFGVFLAYDAWRPLTEAERRLVGTWVGGPTTTGQQMEMAFTSDRRLEMTMVAPPSIRISLGAGSWSIRGNQLRYRLDRRPDQVPMTVHSWSDIPLLLVRPFSRFNASAPVVFEAEDRIDWGNVPYFRVSPASGTN